MWALCGATWSGLGLLAWSCGVEELWWRRDFAAAVLGGGAGGACAGAAQARGQHGPAVRWRGVRRWRERTAAARTSGGSGVDWRRVGGAGKQRRVELG